MGGGPIDFGLSEVGAVGSIPIVDVAWDPIGYAALLGLPMPLILFMEEVGGRGGALLAAARPIITVLLGDIMAGGGIAKGTDAIELELDTSGTDPGGTNVDWIGVVKIGIAAKCKKIVHF